MQLENSLTFVRSLKGAPASILWAFFFTRRVMNALELQEWTGYKGDNITVAVRLLVNLGWLIARSPRGPWCLADGRQFPLMGDSDLIGVADSVVVNVESEETQDSLSTTLTNRRMNPIKSDSSKKILSIRQIVKDPDEINACLAALHELKVYGKKADRIAEDHHITVADIQAHWKTVQSQAWDNPQGMLIYLLENHVPTEEPAATEPPAASARYSSEAWGQYLNQESEEP